MKAAQNKIPLLLIFLFCIATALHAQTNDSTSSHTKGFFKGWRLAGISGFRSQLINPNQTSVVNFFKDAATTDAVLQKIDFDLNEIQKFNLFQAYQPRGKLNTGSFGVVFKPRDTNSARILNYAELFAGIEVSILNPYIVIIGDTATGIGYHKNNFSTSYTARINTLNLHFGFTLQTPVIIQVISLYAGVGVYGGGTTFESFRTEESRFKGKTSSTQYFDTIISTYPAATTFKVGTFSGGIFFPLGIKFNVSARSNIFIEFNARRTSYLTKNGWNEQWYRGWGFGYRYKIFQNSAAKAPAKGAAAPPEPFY
jgi:hypothetical protein